MIYAVLLLGGKGSRCSDVEYKQYIKINNIELFIYPFSTLASIDKIDKLILVVDHEHFNHVVETVKQYPISKPISIIEGGQTRKESVFNALKFIDSFKDCEYVVIHDAARFLMKKELVLKSLEALKKYDATSIYTHSFDTLASINDKSCVGRYYNRDKIMKIQTPQCFKFDIILKAHIENDFDSFDDGYLVMLESKDVYLIEGDEFNFKVTTYVDVAFGEFLIKTYGN